jgi:signal transduction histidine kinase
VASVKRPDVLKLAGGALAVILVLLATLQYRWLREIADAQRSRLKADAASRAGAMADDFDREVTRAYLLLQVDAETARTRDAVRYARQVAEYRAAAPWPGLVRETFVFDRGDDGTESLLRFDEAAGRLAPVDWPPGLEAVRRALTSDAPRRLGGVVPEVPALVAPVPEVLTELRDPAPGTGLEVRHSMRALVARHSNAGGPRRSTILVLDRELLLGRVLPELLARHGAAPGTGRAEYEAAVLDRDGRALIGADKGAGDAGSAILRLRYDDIDSAILRSFVPDALRTGEHSARMTIRVVESLPVRPGEPPPGGWRLVLRHRRGSVEQAVSAALARNLALSALVLGVLGAGMALLVASARRERALARQQMEFVAAVSHELRTPLTAIRSAGDNLADGLVREPAQVQRYGALVRDEGLRLSEMVEQTLGFAGADVPARPARPVELGPLIERGCALAGEPGAPSAPFTVERDVAPGLPTVLGDAAALERAVANLVANARRHAAAGGRARVSARGSGTPPRAVVIEVSDDGPGIPEDEQRRLFEPFFRGRAAREAQVPGSGLGLAVVRRIVEAHRGRLTVRSAEGRGSTFTITLPAGAAAPDPVPDAAAHPAR